MNFNWIVNLIRRVLQMRAGRMITQPALQRTPPEPPMSKPGTIRFRKDDEQQARTLEAGVPHLAVHATLQALLPDHPGAHSRRDSEFP